MPRGDRTGPWGMGPMTGRAAGYCAGYNVPGYANPGPAGYGAGYGGAGYGYGYGRGGGRGGAGRGMAWRRGRGGAWAGQAGWPVAGVPPMAPPPQAAWAPPMAWAPSAPWGPFPQGPAPIDERSALEQGIAAMKAQLEQLTERLAALDTADGEAGE